MKHTCHAHDCAVPVRPEMLMCKKHWYMVPKHLRDDVYKHYRVGQCDDRDPSPAWHEAADLAIAAVAEHEGHDLAASHHLKSAEFWAARKGNTR